MSQVEVHVARILLLGAGGHGKVVSDVVRALNLHVAGFTDTSAARIGELAEPGGARVIITQQALLEALERSESLPAGATCALVTIGRNDVRLRLSLELGVYLSEALIHPLAVVSPSARIGAGSVLLPGVIVNAAARVGLAAILNTGCIIEHDCALGDGVHVSPRATLCGGVTVGDRAWIGAGATVIPGVTIGADVIVGAGSTVIRDVPAGLTVVGAPARARPTSGA